ncbi:MAG: heavy metal translocating P-type ATPase [Bacillota bacterium]
MGAGEMEATCAEGLDCACCTSAAGEGAGRHGNVWSVPGTDKTVLYLSGLACANCAAKIENAVKGIAGVQSASVDFVSKRLTIHINNKHEAKSITGQAERIARQIEPDIEITQSGTREGPASEKTTIPKGKAIRFVLGLLAFAAALAGGFPFWIGFALYLAGYLLAGADVVLKAAKNMIKGRVFDENFLMSIATIGAFAIQEFPEGVAVMLFYRLGEFFEQIAVNRSRRSIGALMDIRPDYANLKAGGEVKRVSPEEVHIGDTIVVKPGEKIPLDGIVAEGASALDTSALTGESLPREVAVGSEVLSGSININGLLAVKVTADFGQSTVSRILDLVQNASEKKAPTESLITKFARYYTPAVVLTALALAVVPPLVLQGAFTDWINRALVFLVVSCPCALVLSVPLGFFGGIGAASRNGILVKGGNYLEALNTVDTVVFDKTGTLTRGVFQVTRIAALTMGEETLLEYAAYAESSSNHPVALSVLRAYGREVNRSEIESCGEIPGHGVKARVRGKEVLAGNDKLMERENIPFDKAEDIGTAVYVAVDGKYAGYLVIADEIRKDAESAVRELRKTGIRKLIMLTGDSKPVAETIGGQLGLDEVHAELLPGGKVVKLEALSKQSKGKVLFAGDGINDAPVLARADVGVAMGGLGSDAAIEAADIVLMTDEPSKLVRAIQIAKRTRGIVWQNILFALGVKAVVLCLGAGGIATMWEAVFADVGVALLAVLNAMRVMQFR